MKVVKRLVSGTPLELLARWAFYRATGNVAASKNWNYDRQTFEVMRKTLRPDSCFVDVGCHTGDILREAVRLSPLGAHWAFEPLPHLASALKTEFPGVNVFDMALSDREGETSFTHVTSSPALSGLQKRQMSTDEITESITVPTNTLDNIVGSSHIDMIKIDVEGAELLVLRGAVKTISRDKPLIVFEHGLGGADTYGHTPEQVYDSLSSCGLNVSTMKRWLNRAAPFTSCSAFSAHWRAGSDFYFMAYLKDALGY